MACNKTLLVGGRDQYKDDKFIKTFIIIKCMATLFLIPSYGRRRGWGNVKHWDIGILVSLSVT